MGVTWAWVFLAFAPRLARGALLDDLESASPGDLKVLLEFDTANPRQNSARSARSATFVKAQSEPGVDSSDTGLVHIQSQGRVEVRNHGLEYSPLGFVNRWSIMMDISFEEGRDDSLTPLFCMDGIYCDGAEFWFFAGSAAEWKQLGAQYVGWVSTEVSAGTFYRLVVTANLNNEGTARIAFYLNGRRILDATGALCRSCDADGLYSGGRTIVLHPAGDDPAIDVRLTTVAIWDTDLTEEAVVALGPPSFGAEGAPQCAAMDLVGALLTRPALPPAWTPGVNTCGRTCCRGAGPTPCREIDMRWRYNERTGVCEQDPLKEVCLASRPQNEANAGWSHPLRHFGIFCARHAGSAATPGEVVLAYLAPDYGISYWYASMIAFFAAVRYFFAGHVISLGEIHPALREVLPVAFYIQEDDLGADLSDPGIEFVLKLRELFTKRDPAALPASEPNSSRAGAVYLETDLDLESLLRGPGAPAAPTVTVTAAWEELCDAAGRAGISSAGDTGTEGTGFVVGGRCMPTTLDRAAERDIGFGYTAKCKQWRLLFTELGIRKFGYVFAHEHLSSSHRYTHLEALFNACFERCAIKSETLDSELRSTCLQETVELCTVWDPSPTCLPFDEALRRLKYGTVAGATHANDVRVLLFAIAHFEFGDFRDLFETMKAENVTGDRFQLLFYDSPADFSPLYYQQLRDEHVEMLDGAVLLLESCDGQRWHDFASFLGQLNRSDFPVSLNRLDHNNVLSWGEDWDVGTNPNRDFAKIFSAPEDGGGLVEAGMGSVVDATLASLIMMNGVLSDLGVSLRSLPYFVLDRASRNITFPGVCGSTVSFDERGQQRSAIKMKMYSVVPHRSKETVCVNNACIWKFAFVGSVTESAFTRQRPNRFHNGNVEIVAHVPPYCLPGHEALDDLRCHKCQPGFYSNKEGRYLKCLPCEPGTFSDREGSVACSACEAGSAAMVEGMRACTLCAEGRFQPAQRKSSCILCGPGTSTSERGSERCTPCLRGSYQELEGQHQCIPCTGGRETPDIGTVSSSRCGCPWGKYEDAGATCAPCPDKGLVCPGSDLPPLQAAGYAAAPARRGELPLRLVRCRDALSCPDGLPMGECPENRVGMACGQCRVGYVEVGDQCQPCEERGAAAHLPVIFGTVGFFACLAGAVAYASDSASPTHHQSKITVMITLGLVTQALQAISAFATFSITWTEPLASLQRVLSIFTDVFQLECSLRAESEAAQYALTLIVYPAFAVSAQLGFLLYSKRRRRLSFDDQLNAQGAVLMIAYLPLLLVSLRPWQCKANPDGTLSMQTAPNVQCWGAASPEHMAMIVLSSLSLLSLCGYIALIVWAVLNYPNQVIRINGGLFLKRFRFLFYHFSVKRYYYSFIHSTRSLAIALCPVLFTGQPRLQVMLVMITVVSVSILQAHFRPWRIVTCNVLDSILGVNLLLILAAGVMLDGTLGGAGDDATLQACLYVYLLCILLAGLIAGSTYSIKVLFPQKRFGAFLCHHKAGAGSMARWLKIELGSKLAEVVFLDSDNLHNLDTLFHMVAHQTKNLVVLLTRDVLLRPWCAGEMATAVREGLSIVPVACGDFLGFTQDAVDGAGCTFSGSEVTMLAMLGVTVPMIRDAFKLIGALGALHINRSDPYVIHEQLADAVLEKCQSVTRLPHSTTKAGRRQENSVVILGGRHHEVVMVSHIIRMLLQRVLQKGVAVLDCPLDEAASQARNVTHIVVVLVPGILHDMFFARYLSLVAGTAKLLGVRADDSFCFPDSQFWADLSNGLILDPVDVTLPKVTELYRRLFVGIATSFTPHGSSRVQDSEIQALIDRMHNTFEAPRTGNGRRDSCNGRDNTAWGRGPRTQALHGVDQGQTGPQGDEESVSSQSTAVQAAQTGRSAEGPAPGGLLPGLVLGGEV